MIKLYLATVILIVLISSEILSQSIDLTKFECDSTFLNHVRSNNLKLADTNRILSVLPIDGKSPKIVAPQHFPYPVIFIHGLTGSADTWAEYYNYLLTSGWSYGGQLPYTLNSDYSLNECSLSSGNMDISSIPNTIVPADFYIINFNCSPSGEVYGGQFNDEYQSNQAGLKKQGLAISEAINRVIEETGKNKVILFGHSMGGLAAREYLQNENIWSSFNHNIAKLVTTGTPHAGSNTTGTFLVDFFSDLDERSDAVRDLRRTYFYSGDDGVFLYGGRESSSVMNDNLLGFHNYDVNCNGVIGNTIIGLNSKPIFGDLDYSCIIGEGAVNGDGVVRTQDAQIKNLYGVRSETVRITSNNADLHTRLPRQIQANFYGLDEPDYYDLAYEVKTEQVYNGYYSSQQFDSEFFFDYDDYVFTLDGNRSVSINYSGMSNDSFGIGIIALPSEEIMYYEIFIGSGEIETSVIDLPAGDYVAEFVKDPRSDDWELPYSFTILSQIISSNNQRGISSDHLLVYPNPTTETIKFKTGFSGNMSCTVYNILGEIIKTEIVNPSSTISVENLESGTYFLTLQSKGQLLTESFIKH